MNHRISVLSLSIAIGLSGVPLAASAADLRTVSKPVEGQYIVVLKAQAASLAGESSRAARVATVASSMASQHRVNLVRSYEQVLRGFVARADDAALARLLADPRVEYIEEDGEVQASATQSGATWGID